MSLLAKEGPTSLYLLELEANIFREQPKSLGIYIELARLSGSGTQMSHARLWLHARKERFLSGRSPVSRALLLAAYPSLDQQWPKWASTARHFQLDARLVATLLLHLRGFHPSTRRFVRSGPTPEPLWLPRPLNPSPKDFSDACKRLARLLKRYKHVDLALEAFLTQDLRYVDKLRKTYRKKPWDLRLLWLSPETLRVLQTYWIYQYLYLP